MTTNTGATGDKGVPADKDAVTKPQIDTTNFDEAERIAEVNRRADVQEELDLAAEEKREPASWAVLDLPSEEEEAEVESEEEEVVVEKKEEVVVKKEEVAAEDPLVKILVDGVEREVPLSKIVDAGKRTLQKESAADKRLEEASKLLKEAKEVTKLPAKAAEDSEASKLNLNKLRTDYVHASQYGTEEEALLALTAWEEAIVKQKGTQPATPVVTQDDIKRVIKATELETLVNASPEEGGFSDLMSNPVLKEQTRVLVDNLVTNKQGSYDSFDTYKRAGEAVRLIGATLDPAYTPPVVVAKKKDSFENKRESKKKIVNIKPASAVSTSKVIEDPDKELSVSEEIAQMKAARGQ